MILIHPIHPIQPHSGINVQPHGPSSSSRSQRSWDPNFRPPKTPNFNGNTFFGWCSKNSIGWPPNKSTHPIGKLFYQISKSSVHMIWMRICVSSGFLPRSSGHFDPDGCSFHAAECGSHGLALPRSERSEATAASRYGGWRCLGEELSKYGHLDWTDFNLLWYTLENTWNYTKIVILPGINGYEWVLMGRPWDYMVMYRWFTLLKILVFSHSYVKWNDWWYVRLGQSNVASWKISSV